MSGSVPKIRIAEVNGRPVRPGGDYVLYWMIANRRTRRNFALQRAVDLARELDRPLVILEALRCGYDWASERLHRFVIDGMADNAAALESTPALYHPYVEPEPGAGKGLLAALAGDACVVVTDDWPAFFLPRMVEAAARQIDVAVESVDSNGMLPMASTDEPFKTAFSFRRFLQKNLPSHLDALAKVNPLSRVKLRGLDRLPTRITRRWPAASRKLLAGEGSALGKLPIDHSVAPVSIRGGQRAGRKTLKRFLNERIDEYAERRNEPEEQFTSGLSPYLHFGHVASQEVFSALMKRQEWFPGRLSERADGRREGWWGAGKAAEAFLDQLVTWRELGFNMCRHRPDHATYESLPAWAVETLEEHAEDERSHVYSLEEFEAAETHDELWNAAQRQLRRDGMIHNYLRMLWGKKILEWSASPREALEVMIHLNDKYAVDGRDPNSYSGILWCLGRYDRPWGPERPVFGKIRYMSSANTRRKVRVDRYLERYGPVKA